MATSIDVNVKIGSLIGATQTTSTFISGRPSVQTTGTMNGTVNTVIEPDIPLLSISPLGPFASYVGIVSPQQDVVLTNVGNAELTITEARFSRRGGTTPAFYWTPTVALYNTLTSSSSTITILPGSTATFQMAYLGSQVGEFSNFITFFSNSVTGAYKINTIQQIVPDNARFELLPSSFTCTTTESGRNSSVGINLVPTINGVVDPLDPQLSFTTSIQGSPGWYVSSTSINSLVLTFDPDYVNNVTGTYISTLTVAVVNGAIEHFTSTATVAIVGEYRNLSYWLSPAAAYNSLIGVSFDIINNIKTVTIGVGMGADGSPIYANGGSRFATTSTLGIKFMTIDSPYPYWATVCSIPLDEFPATYLSGALDELDQPMYIKKTTDGLNYADYFGFEQGVGSIFIVNHDGGGNVTIEINNLRELSGDAEFDATLQNLTRAFYYYSQIDLPVRYNQLTTLDLADPRIPLFRGFSMYFTPPDTNPKWAVETSHVRLPT